MRSIVDGRYEERDLSGGSRDRRDNGSTYDQGAVRMKPPYHQPKQPSSVTTSSSSLAHPQPYVHVPQPLSQTDTHPVSLFPTTSMDSELSMFRPARSVQSLPPYMSRSLQSLQSLQDLIDDDYNSTSNSKSVTFIDNNVRQSGSTLRSQALSSGGKGMSSSYSGQVVLAIRLSSFCASICVQTWIMMMCRRALTFCTPSLSLLPLLFTQSAPHTHAFFLSLVIPSQDSDRSSAVLKSGMAGRTALPWSSPALRSSPTGQFLSPHHAIQASA
jgi:hypothetical protein